MTDVNNNLKYVLSTDILAFALSDNAKVGLTSGHFSGDGYVGELPDPQLKYGTFEINRRNTGSISIKCFDIDHNSIWTNSHSNNTWKGWKKVAAIANSAHIALFQIDFYYAGAEITLNSDVTNYNRLIFLFGSPNSPDNGYETEEVYPWGIIYGSNELGAKQPNIGMTIRGEKVVFKWLSNTKIKYVSGSADLRCIYGFEE